MSVEMEVQKEFTGHRWSTISVTSIIVIPTLGYSVSVHFYPVTYLSSSESLSLVTSSLLDYE